MLRRPALFAWLMASACQPDMPTLELIAAPARIDGRGGVTTITATAMQNATTPGTGSVRLSSTVGSFHPAKTLTLDALGTASETFTCETAAEPECTSRVVITGDWLFKGVDVPGEVRVAIQAPTAGGATGGGTSGGATGGGTSGGGTSGGATGGGTSGGATSGGTTGGGTSGGATGGGTSGGATSGGTSGGATSGGTTGGGTTGGGSAGGSRAGGSSGGGVSGGGTSGGGAAGGGGVDLHYTPAVLSPDAITLFGTLVPMSCQGALSPLGSSSFFIGVPCGLIPTVTALQPDGGFIYQHPTSQRIFAAVPDALAFTTSYAYPTTLDNDVDLTPTCAGTLTSFVVRPNGGVVGKCPNGSWVEGSTVLPNLTNENVIAFAASGEALVVRATSTVIIAPGGAVTTVNTSLTPTSKMTRWTPTGFLTVQTTPTCSLYSIALNGTATKLGDYTMTGVQPPICNGRIDSTGVLYFGLSGLGGARIIRRPLEPGTSTEVFNNTTPTTWNFNPTFRLVLIDGLGMTTGR